MPSKLNYKSALTLFYHLLRSEYEGKGNFMRVKDGVTSGSKAQGKDPDPDAQHRSDAKRNQLNSLMAILRICGHAKRVNALAWVKREMLINAQVLVEDSPIYRKIIKEFRISEKEVNQAMVRIT